MHMMALLATVAAGALAAPVAVATEEIVVPTQPRQRELMHLLKHDCGACHGMRLTGGLGPALTPQALQDKPAASLVATIVSGRPGTAMPPWRPFLTEAEAEWLVARLQKGDTDAR
jgi:cytochrome c55X